MSENPPAGVKACAGCGADVSNAPRLKDAQGRYFCKACAAKMQAKATGKAPAPAPRDRGADDVMAKLVEDSVAKGATSCPACRRPWREGAVICTNCGYNKQTAQMTGTQVKAGDRAGMKPPKGKPRGK